MSLKSLAKSKALFFIFAAINFVLGVKLFIDSVFLMGYTEGVICGRIFLMFKDIRIL